MADIDSFKYAQVRQKILDAVRQDLIGPIGGENEVLEKDSPTQTYITGILFPADSAITEDENYNDIEFTDAGPDSEGENYGFNTDEDETPEDSVKKGFQRPSSMGISFYIKSDVKQLNATVRYGKYTQETKKEITSCPQCDGKIVEKKTKRGKIFYGCNNYPKCNFASWDIPTGERCPNCNSLLVENKKNIKCAKCEYIKEK